ncbi:sporozoite invasion-associated protein 1, putative [Plasmodium relictum]|uniref:Sporozoite invasion-associated protein 1, putative n=1 Tax=Plasmodium relictum TaxID=85471 RepID=A0A1J1H1B8_PLARL|nr:sporozoite invasion-associated protein 1, putative [Plasmodium relictum]CRG98573.1 sporozoite invasion-associated protein 1, putative [Plasmodium relictum]
MKEKYALTYLFLMVVLYVVKGYNVRNSSNPKNISNYNDSESVVIRNTRALTPKEENELRKMNLHKQMTFIQASSSSSNMMHDQELKIEGRIYEVTGVVNGITKGHPLAIALGAQYSNYFDFLEIIKLTDTTSRFKFLVKPGKYYLRIYGNTYMTPSAIKISIPCDKCKYVNGSYNDRIRVSPYKSDPNLFIYNWELQVSSPIPLEHINTVHNDEADWFHGNTLNDELKLDSSAAATTLKTFYGIELTGIWGSEYSDRLLSVISEFPDCVKLVTYDKNARALQRKHQKWILINGDLGAFDMDIELHNNPEYEYSKTVRVSANAFSFSQKLVKNPGNNGKYFSRRLEKVIIRALFTHDFQLFSTYFEQKHGVTLLDPNSNELMIKQITGYEHKDYQPWSQNIEELVEIATSWDEYPKGFQKVKGLRYLVRRKNGLKHPVYPTAPAVAFPGGSERDSFLEFMESAFVNYSNISHLVLHEIGHFIYENNLPIEFKNEWMELGKWYKEPLSPSSWASRLEVEFVSAYAHDKNPGEDFAESIASFVLNPRLLSSRSPKKYKWLKEKVFRGSFYTTSGSHLFEVLNLGNEIFYYPGKVKKIYAKVIGSPTENKQVKVDIYLLSTRGSDGCAKHAYARLFSEQQTYRDVFFFPKDGSECSHHLYGEFSMNPSESRGRWVSESLTFTGQNDINRYTGIGSFLFYIYINNQNEDLEKPIPLLNSISVHPYDSSDTENSLIRLQIMVLEDHMLKKQGGTYTNFASKDNNSYSFFNYTYEMYEPEFNAEIIEKDYFLSDISTNGFRQVSSESCKEYTDMDISKLKCFQVVNPVSIPKYCIGNRLYLRQFSAEDEAGNQSMINISSDKFFADLKPGTERDTHEPVVYNVKVSSKSANKNHDGETIVTVDFSVFDDLSGVFYIYIFLRDPHGGIHRSSVNRSILPNGVGMKNINHKILLPKGSMGGTWMLDEIKAVDRCKNESRNIYSYSVYVENS